MNIFSIWNRGRGAGAQPKTIQLSSQQLWSARAQTGQSIICESGTVWLTQSGNSHDYILRAGQIFVVRGREQIVVQAIEDAVLRVKITSPSSSIRLHRHASPKYLRRAC